MGFVVLIRPMPFHSLFSIRQLYKMITSTWLLKGIQMLLKPLLICGHFIKKVLEALRDDKKLPRAIICRKTGTIIDTSISYGIRTNLEWLKPLIKNNSLMESHIVVILKREHGRTETELQRLIGKEWSVLFDNDDKKEAFKHFCLKWN